MLGLSEIGAASSRRFRAQKYRLGKFFCAALLVCPALTGCNADSGLTADASFNAADPATAADGIVVVGMRLIRPATVPVLFVFKTQAHAIFQMQFKGIDAANHFTGVQRMVQVCDTSTLTLVVPCEPTQMRYRAIRLPAGRYVLTDFVLRENKLQADTNFVGAPPSLIPRKHDQSADKPPALITFNIEPGKATYIGDFNWDPETFPAKFAVTRDDAAARATLAAFPGISAPLVYEPVTRMLVAAYPTRG